MAASNYLRLLRISVEERQDCITVKREGMQPMGTPTFKNDIVYLNKYIFRIEYPEPGVLRVLARQSCTPAYYVARSKLF